MTRRVLSAFAFLLACSGIGSASMLFTTPGTGAVRTGDGFSLGAKFTYNGPSMALVTDLGILDVSGEAWDHSHEIGLWDVSQSNLQIADGTVDNGGTLISGFRYVHLNVQVLLTTGHQYTLGAYYFPTASSNDHLQDHGGTDPTPDPLFSAFTAEFSSSNTAGALTEPTGNTFGAAYVGPNFIFQAPEPATFALTGCGALALLLIRKALNRPSLKR
jgi:hypothetical protein